MKTVPSGRVEWFMNGACSVGGIAGGGYVGMAPPAVWVSVGRPVRRASEDVLSAGRVRGEVDDDDDEEVVSGGGESVELADVAAGVFVCCVVVCCVGLVVDWAVVFCESPGLLALLLLLLPWLLFWLLFALLFWATTPRAKKAESSRARFSESGDDLMVVVVAPKGDRTRNRKVVGSVRTQYDSLDARSNGLRKRLCAVVQGAAGVEVSQWAPANGRGPEQTGQAGRSVRTGGGDKNNRSYNKCKREDATRISTADCNEGKMAAGWRVVGVGLNFS
jgi:hypothetical protein